MPPNAQVGGGGGAGPLWSLPAILPKECVFTR